ncbi:hypothetical protein ACIRP0_26550 [Streptomyces sp. NPDC101733]|uniref:hypothetical protein n=1 Tax=unclassified Streptomyces TaxID=2593676 RepID=UPI00381024A4
MSIVITAGQRGDPPQFEAVLGRIRVPRPGTGRPRNQPRRVRADKAYARQKNRAYLRTRGIQAPRGSRPGTTSSPSATRRPCWLQSPTSCEPARRGGRQR